MNNEEMMVVDEITSVEPGCEDINWEESPEGEISLEYLLYVLDID